MYSVWGLKLLVYSVWGLKLLVYSVWGLQLLVYGALSWRETHVILGIDGGGVTQQLGHHLYIYIYIYRRFSYIIAGLDLLVIYRAGLDT